MRTFAGSSRTITSESAARSGAAAAGMWRNSTPGRPGCQPLSGAADATGATAVTGATVAGALIDAVGNKVGIARVGGCGAMLEAPQPTSSNAKPRMRGYRLVFTGSRSRYNLH